jgi:hypothetical protein
MRTTLNLDDDVLELARTVAIQQKRSLGEVVSGLIRRAVEPPKEPQAIRNGMPLFPVARVARRVTPEVVEQLLQEDS